MAPRKHRLGHSTSAPKIDPSSKCLCSSEFDRQARSNSLVRYDHSADSLLPSACPHTPLAGATSTTRGDSLWPLRNSTLVWAHRPEPISSAAERLFAPGLRMRKKCTLC